MTTTAKQQEFAALFLKYMEPSGTEAQLAKFITQLPHEDARDCGQSYFKLAEDYLHARQKASRIFFLLAIRGIETGDVYFALRLQIWVGSARTQWESHYRSLRQEERGTLQARIKKKKEALTYYQREFIELFDLYMRGKISQQKLQKRTDKPATFSAQRDYLFAYVEVSAGYPQPNSDQSLLIFRGLSLAALWKGGASFAHWYEGKVNQQGTLWHERYTSVKPEQLELIRKTIRDQQVIRSDVKVGDKTHKNVPIGTYQSDPVPAEKDRSDRDRTAPRTKLQKDFIGLYDRYLRADKGVDAAVHEFLRTHGAEDLQQCVETYLKVSETKATPLMRAMRMFFIFVSTAVAKSEAYYALKVNALIHTVGNVWARRFESLNEADKPRLEQDIALRIKSARLIDRVKLEYFEKHRVDPKLQALRDFESVYDSGEAYLLDKVLSSFEVAVKVKDVDGFDKAFKDLTELLWAQKSNFVLLSLVKRCRERQSLYVQTRLLLYVYGVGILFSNLLREASPAYLKQISKEEWNWLLEGVGTGRYYKNDLAQLDYLLWKRSTREVLAQVYRGEGILHVYADLYGLQLTPSIEAGALRGSVEEAWRKQGEQVRKQRIPIESRYDKGVELKIGDTIGNFYILWWDSIHDVAYVQVNGFDQVVFEMRPVRLAKAYDEDATFGQIARSTAHLLVLIPLFFEILSTFFDYIASGGVIGMLKDRAFDYVFEKSMAAFGVDPMQAQVAMMGSALLTRGFKPKGATGSHKQAVHVADTRPDSAVSRTGTDMRGIDNRDGTITIRGADSGNSSTTRTTADARATGGKATSKPDAGSTAIPDKPAQVVTREELARAEDRLKEAQSRLDQAARTMEQKKNRLGDVEANVEAAQGKRHLPALERELQAAKQAERNAVAEYRNRKHELKGAQRRADMLRRDLARRGELEKMLGNKWKLPDKPTKFRRGKVEVDSWLPDAWVGTSDNRSHPERLLQEEPNGPLSEKLLHNGELYPAVGGDMEHWIKHPEMMELAHVLTRAEGGREVFILMTKARNQAFGRRHERTGGIFKDEAIVIQRIAIDRLSAQDLGLSQELIDKARVIKF